MFISTIYNMVIGSAYINLLRYSISDNVTAIKMTKAEKGYRRNGQLMGCFSKLTLALQ